jgi:hypothetical protein
MALNQNANLSRVTKGELEPPGLMSTGMDIDICISTLRPFLESIWAYVYPHVKKIRYIADIDTRKNFQGLYYRGLKVDQLVTEAC